MPWVTFTDGTSLNGMYGSDGKVTLVLGAAAFVVLLWIYFRLHIIPSILAVILGVMVASMMGYKIYDFESSLGDVPDLAFAAIGFGIYAGLIDGIIIIVSGFWLTRLVPELGGSTIREFLREWGLVNWTCP